VSENILLRTFGPKKEDPREGWRKLHNVELHDLYVIVSIFKVITSRRMKWPWYVARMEKAINAYGIIIANPKEICLGVDWTISIKIHLKEISCQVVDWFHLAQDRSQWRALINTIMNL
jgi:hypothetical protein